MYLQKIIKCNRKIVQYLDVILNLNDGTYYIFFKPNDSTVTSMSNLTILEAEHWWKQWPVIGENQQKIKKITHVRTNA